VVGCWAQESAHGFDRAAQATLERVGARGNTGDLDSQPFYRFIERTYGLHVLAMFAALFAVGGLPAVVWGGALRCAWVYHITWFVNSASHVWGYQSYNTGDQRRAREPACNPCESRTCREGCRRPWPIVFAPQLSVTVVLCAGVLPSVLVTGVRMRTQPQQLVGGSAGVRRGLAQQPPRIRVQVRWPRGEQRGCVSTASCLCQQRSARRTREELASLAPPAACCGECQALTGLQSASAPALSAWREALTVPRARAQRAARLRVVAV